MGRNCPLLGFSPHAFPRPAETQSREGDRVTSFLGAPTVFKVHRIKEDAPHLNCLFAHCLMHQRNMIGMTMAVVGHIPPLLGGLVLQTDRVRVHCEGGGPRRTWNKGHICAGGGRQWVDVISPCPGARTTEEKVCDWEMLEEEQREEGEDGRGGRRQGRVSKYYPPPKKKS